MPGIDLRNVGKVFDGDVTAVSGLDLEVADGELLVLLGPSGCGKSTVLRLVAGLETLTTGEIHLGGRRIDTVPAKDRDVAMVFQSYALYGHMTVRGNLEFPLRMRGVGAEERRRRAAEVARLLELDPILEHRPAALSGGQQQRVAMGRALVREPSAFLLDEPLSNLDARLRGQVRVHIAELQRRLGITTLYVTHDQVEALSLGHRIAVLRGGRLQQVGPGRALYDRPANAFVAQFVGQPGMNLMVGRLHRRDGRWSVDVGAATLALPERSAFSGRDGDGSGGEGGGSSGNDRGSGEGADRARPRDGQEVLVGVRPDGLTLAEGRGDDGASGSRVADGAPSGGAADRSDAGDGPAHLTDGEVRTVEAIGPAGVCYVASGVRTIDMSVDEPEGGGGPPLAVRTERAGRLEPGHRVGVRIEPKAIRLFARDGSALG